MTSAEMLAQVRTFLDESSSGFWTDSEIYTALTKGQIEIVNYALTIYSQTKKLMDLLTNITQDATNTNVVGGDYVQVADDFLQLITCKVGSPTGATKYTADIVSYNTDLEKDIENKYFTPSRTNPIVWIRSNLSIKYIYTAPTSSSHDYYYIYIKKPTDISASIEPVLPPYTHFAIVKFAFAELLQKDQQIEKSQLLLKEFYDLLKSLSQ